MWIKSISQDISKLRLKESVLKAIFRHPLQNFDNSSFVAPVRTPFYQFWNRPLRGLMRSKSSSREDGKERKAIVYLDARHLELSSGPMVTALKTILLIEPFFQIQGSGNLR